jgi:hypothetical protein
VGTTQTGQSRYRRDQMSKKDKGPPDFRDSKSGHFVKEDYAKKHPDTTEKEHNRPPPKPKDKK